MRESHRPLSVTACYIQPQSIYFFMRDTIFWIERSAWHLLVSCLTSSSTLKMEICSSDESVDFYRTTQRYDPKDPMLHGHRCENLRSNILQCYELIFMILCFSEGLEVNFLCFRGPMRDQISSQPLENVSQICIPLMSVVTIVNALLLKIEGYCMQSSRNAA